MHQLKDRDWQGGFENLIQLSTVCKKLNITI